MVGRIDGEGFLWGSDRGGNECAKDRCKYLLQGQFRGSSATALKMFEYAETTELTELTHSANIFGPFPVLFAFVRTACCHHHMHHHPVAAATTIPIAKASGTNGQGQRVVSETYRGPDSRSPNTNHVNPSCDQTRHGCGGQAGDPFAFVVGLLWWLSIQDGRRQKADGGNLGVLTVRWEFPTEGSLPPIDGRRDATSAFPRTNQPRTQNRPGTWKPKQIDPSSIGAIINPHSSPGRLQHPHGLKLAPGPQP